MRDDDGVMLVYYRGMWYAGSFDPHGYVQDEHDYGWLTIDGILRHVGRSDVLAAAQAEHAQLAADDAAREVGEEAA